MKLIIFVFITFLVYVVSFTPMRHHIRLPLVVNTKMNGGGDGVSSILFGLAEVFGKLSNGFLQKQPPNDEKEEHSDKTPIRTEIESIESIGAEIKKEYEKLFWVTGNMRMQLWAPDCIFADPFSSFGGPGSTKRFKSNADNLGKFVIQPRIRITTYSIDETELNIKVGWSFSSKLDLPWKPVLAAVGVTSHYLNKETMLIEKYEEVWKSKPWDVVKRLFVPTHWKSNLDDDESNDNGSGNDDNDNQGSDGCEHVCADAWNECIESLPSNIHHSTKRSLSYLLATLIVINPYLPINVAPLSPAPAMALDLDALRATEKQTINLFEVTTPSVVYIDTFTQRLDVVNMNIMEVPAGTGTGFVWDKLGHIVTNYHVIRNAKNAKVYIKDDAMSGTNGVGSKVYTAKVTGVDPDKDIAVLKIEADGQDLKPIKVGTSSTLKVGQTTFAIGNPFGLDHTLTTGVVSGLGREVKSPTNRPISNVIQTDASINPGNSGGPLLNSEGKLIGMNTAIYTMSGTSAGIGFAIPVDTLKQIVATIINDGFVVRPIIGITYLESSQARFLGIDKGILVLDAPASSAAGQVGIQGTRRDAEGNVLLGDIIVGVDDDDIKTEGDLFKAIEKHKVGDEIILTVRRMSQEDGGNNAYNGGNTGNNRGGTGKSSDNEVLENTTLQFKVKLTAAPAAPAVPF